ncbi:hypothetical protein PIB30_083086 [Stylosanthes scabra]|uniref:Uncharacterized protein n=1 Tax=Stylosanthes scabra TaxID=79078 RepID=A0ABU6WS39_9FABA|nr:hypothetical protein [Stylosanthes scabra]
MDYVPVTYKRLNADQKDTADLLVKLFSERNLKPKTVLSNPSEAREAIDPFQPSPFLFRAHLCFPPILNRSRLAEDVLPFPHPSLPPRPGRRPADDASADPKRPRVSEGTTREFYSLDRFFDASGFIENNLLGPRPQEVLKDYDPIESIRWA